MQIAYKLTGAPEGERERFVKHIEGLVKDLNIKEICEVGGGAKPALSVDFIKSNNLKYTVLDISDTELAKAPNDYCKVKADIASPSLSLNEKYDFIFSHMLAEHVKDGETFYKNISNLLRPNGLSFHVFPTLYSLPFIVNFILPESISRSILERLTLYRKNPKSGKFPAHYSWCRGPSRAQIERFKKVGLSVEEFIGFFGTPCYFRKIKPLKMLDHWVSSFLLQHPQPFATSYAHVLLRKPSQ
jgi:2-polyprenyl-3-methyl-5-hydroxy-6-metoxy-1,4-benzoquinol methylase